MAVIPLFRIDTKTNTYWTRILNRNHIYGVDFYSDYKKTVNANTPQDISQFLSETILRVVTRLGLLLCRVSKSI